MVKKEGLRYLDGGEVAFKRIWPYEAELKHANMDNWCQHLFKHFRVANIDTRYIVHDMLVYEGALKLQHGIDSLNRKV